MIVHEAASQRPDLLERRELIDEIVALMERYLQRPAPRKRKTRT